MATVNYTCPNCAAPLKFNPDKQMFSCEYCMSDFTEKYVQNFFAKKEQKENSAEKQEKKEQEKAKVEELNRKYGESFGYYNTVAEWYDVLIQKSDDYIQMLFLQAKAQSLVNKAVEADEKVNEVKATPESDVEGSMGWFSKMGLYMAQSESYGQIDAQTLIEKHNKEAKDAAVKAAEEQRDAGNALPYLPGHGQTLLRVLPAEEQTVGKCLVDALPGRFVQRLRAQRDAVALPDVGIDGNVRPQLPF